MTRLVARVSAFALCCVAGAAVAATIPPPATPAGTTVDVIQGTRVADPYRWLEDPADPRVQAWSDAQNARTRAWLDALPDAEAIKSRLTKLITATSPVYFVSEVFLDNRYDRPRILASVQRGDGGQWAFYVLREGQPAVRVADYPTASSMPRSDMLAFLFDQLGMTKQTAMQ